MNILWYLKRAYVYLGIFVEEWLQLWEHSWQIYILPIFIGKNCLLLNVQEISRTELFRYQAVLCSVKILSFTFLCQLFGQRNTHRAVTPGYSWCGQDNTPLWKWLKTSYFPLSFSVFNIISNISVIKAQLLNQEFFIKKKIKEKNPQLS